MSTDEYVPSEEDAVDNYVFGRGGDDTGLSLAELRAEYGPEFDRFLTRVRRDAAREALDGLVTDFEDFHESAMYSGLRVNAALGASRAAIYRDTHYPEEAP